jgi:hypothetical protein
MTDLGGTRRAARHQRSSRQTEVMGSAGMPASADDERVAELEARLDRLETSTNLRERGQAMMDKVMPPEASRHFRNAAREQLLGFRSIVDFWIRRVDAMERSASADDPRETIEIQ